MQGAKDLQGDDHDASMMAVRSDSVIKETVSPTWSEEMPPETRGEDSS